MSGDVRDLIDNQAELDDEEDDESFDEDTGRSSRKTKAGGIDDSSDEDDDDSDPEEARRVREGFIVDEEEEEEGEESDVRERRKKKKRRRAEREEEEQLDEEDLDLIGESIPEWERKPQNKQNKFKRIRIGHREESPAKQRRGLDEIFSDEENDLNDNRHYGRPSHRAPADEFEDFIEDDYPEDDEERNQRQEDLEVARPRERGPIVDTTGLDRDALDDMMAIFGNGEEYAWALEKEEEEEDRERQEQPIELKDVFEPSQLAEKMLTDEDNEIRITDEPERFQLDRKFFKHMEELNSDQLFKEEARWIANLLWPKKQLSHDLRKPFNRAIGKVLEFFVSDLLEVPYVFQHKRDYFIHIPSAHRQDSQQDDEEALDFSAEPVKLLNQDDLWRILDLDIKFRSLVDKRTTLMKTYEGLKKSFKIEDKIIEELAHAAVTNEELQDVHEHMNFTYSSELKDLAASSNVGQEVKRPGTRAAVFERNRKSKAYRYVQALGITPDRLALNAQRDGKKVTSEDEAMLPMDFADSLTDGDYATGDEVVSAARQMYAEQLFLSPRIRKYTRANYYQTGWISCRRTEKGLRKIDESHPYYEIKYLLNQTIGDLARRPEIFLKMMKAEEEGLIEVRLTLENDREFRRTLYNELASDNYSDLADAWNAERQKVLDLAFPKLEKVIAKGVKESLRTACQDELLQQCREEYFRRLDQAPYKPKGMVTGTVPKVLTLSNGMGDPNRDPICWALFEADGKLVEHGNFVNLLRDQSQRDAFADLVHRREPEVIGLSGSSADTFRLFRDIENLVQDKNLTCPEYEDDSGEYRSDLLDVVIVNDEVARLYKDSPRGITDHPTLSPLTRYCVGLAKYLQNPMKEYAALGKDISSLLLHPHQRLLPEDKLQKYLESAMVDIVNICGVDINEAMADSSTANLLPYVAGLGPRKASLLIKGINANGGQVNARDELVGDPERHKLQVLGMKVWNNCASFLYVEYEPSKAESEPLDNTRIHPEDYDLARKVAADALGLDEEDVQAETDDQGLGAVVRKLFRDGQQHRVEELILEEYAEQLERDFSQRKRTTLENIRAELQGPYDELRKPFAKLGIDQVFTMLTGETKDSLAEGMIVPVNVRMVKDDFAVVKLDCQVEGRIEASEISYRHSLKEFLHTGQTVQAKILELDRKDFHIRLTMREEEMRRGYRKYYDHDRGTWDHRLEDEDKEELREKDKTTGRTQRVVKHPLFKPFNSTQAEEYLGGQPAGEVVIRPSSKGNDHLAVTWKVADGIYQHIDVLELQKENEFSVGRLLRVGGKWTYTDLDELIVEHVKAMAKKVEQLMQHEKFQKASRADLEKWLTTYMDANPNRATYAFCLDAKRPGYVYLCFKASRNTRVNTIPVRVIPNGYELMKNPYPDMPSLCNGFKRMCEVERSKPRNGGR